MARGIAKAVICPTCGKPEQYWHTVYVGGRSDQSLQDRYGVTHICEAAIPTDTVKASLLAYLSTSVSSSLKDVNGKITEATDRMMVRADAVAGRVESIENSTTNRLLNHESLMYGVKTGMDASLSQFMRDLPSLVKRQVEQIVPVEHRITVKRHDGTATRIEGRPHKEFRRVLSRVELGLDLMLVGPAGSGKTRIASMIAEALGRGYAERSVGPLMMDNDLMGYLSPDGRYVEGTLYRPYKEGRVLCLDEIDHGNASVLDVLNSAYSSDHCMFPNGERVKRHASHVLIMTANTYGTGADRINVGANQLSGPFLDRFPVIDINYDEEAEYQWAGTDMSDWVRWVQRVRHAIGTRRLIVSPRASIKGALMLRAGIPSAEVMQEVVWKGMGRDDKEYLMREAGVFGG